MVQDAALVVITALFVYAHATQLIVHGQLASLVFAIEQSMLVVMFLLRRRSQQTSTRASDWVFASIGGWLPLALRPHTSSVEAAVVGGIALQMIGGSMTLVAYRYLGRSFGVVAANRGLKVQGPYRWVRHPIYATHTLTICGFLIANFSLLNLTLVAVVTAAQLARINSEERLLVATSEYASYRARVRWRLFPGVY
jgi:protein-S-isoprenylcysteine O-methyltransferase Ste14